jgi:DNA-binding protein H-NS
MISGTAVDILAGPKLAIDVGMATLQELLDQKQQLERQIAAMQSQARAEAIAKVKALMNEYGLSVADVAGKQDKASSSPAAGKKVLPKFRDPQSGATWTGRGLQPKWLKAAIAAGKSLEEFSI